MNRYADDTLVAKVRGLSDLVWDDHPTWPEIEQWLLNFVGECDEEDLERRHALYLLSEFLYFGHAQIRELLKAMFDYLIRQPLTVAVREGMQRKQDFDIVHQRFIDELNRTRFLGLGNPAESGTHILYDFRLANELPLNFFLHPHDLLSGAWDDEETKWVNPEVYRLIFIDDFCGTGNQAVQLGKKVVPAMRRIAERDSLEISVWYLTLAATSRGLQRVLEAKLFDVVSTVSELDDTYKVFEPDSKYYGSTQPTLEKDVGKLIAGHYGRILDPGHPFGYENSQLLLGFHHNIPDNTLPIMSRQHVDPPWHPVFRRVAKVGHSEGQS